MRNVLTAIGFTAVWAVVGTTMETYRVTSSNAYMVTGSLLNNAMSRT